MKSFAWEPHSDVPLAEAKHISLLVFKRTLLIRQTFLLSLHFTSRACLELPKTQRVFGRKKIFPEVVRHYRFFSLSRRLFAQYSIFTRERRTWSQISHYANTFQGKGQLAQFCSFCRGNICPLSQRSQIVSNRPQTLTEEIWLATNANKRNELFVVIHPRI